ncbi:hypothetical protein [Nocardia sp. alder85J]|uniref:hypothetical protein n=1 Tax=Nocardia sp. alder85J TaxID=2862949 RepID=UPI001CD2A7C3|nr:hypothetical protein [Nocardia sp. alder85J]MCX4098028.1 hypothetical protein [Nocardia sp. alder85J]
MSLCMNPRCDGDKWLCGKCRKLYPSTARAIDERKRGSQSRNSNRSGGRRNSGGGTYNSTAFRDQPQRSDPSVTNTYFNAGQVDGSSHGHAQYRINPDGTVDYSYVRDVEGNEYDV